jgi:acyl carrier protein
MTVEQKIRAFITSNFFVADDELAGNASLIGSGIIDSTGVLEIILFLEEAFGITVPGDEAIPQNLDTVDNLVRYVTTAMGNVPA